MNENKKSISVVIPAYNEAGNINYSIENLLQSFQHPRIESFEIIVVDDASRDNTAAIVESYIKQHPQIRLIRNVKNKGMGGSLRIGFDSATKEYVASFPGDNGLVPGSMEKMFDVLGDSDMVGYFILNPEFRPWRRRFISWAYVNLLNLLFGLRLKYYNGHAIYKASLIQHLPLTSAGHAFLSEVLIRLLKQKKASYIEVGTVQQERVFGHTKLFSIRNAKTVLKSIFLLFLEVRLGIGKKNF